MSEHFTAVNPISALVAAAYRDLLGLEHCGPDTHFFDCGGTSILAARLSIRLTNLLGKRVGVVQILEHPACSQLTSYCEELIATCADSTAAAYPPAGKGGTRV
jgi:Phosphopantetheine attachment site